MASHTIRVFSLVLPLLAGCGVTQVVDSAPDGTPILIRSPQPDSEELVELHDRYGVKTVVNLRGERPGEEWFEEEADGVAAIGARWVHLPVSGRRPPTEEELERFYALVDEPANWPVLVHCQGGVHRTGALCALYRMHRQGWTAARAVAELEDLWFDWSIEDRRTLKHWLLRGPEEPRRAVAGATAKLEAPPP